MRSISCLAISFLTEWLSKLITHSVDGRSNLAKKIAKKNLFFLFPLSFSTSYLTLLRSQNSSYKHSTRELTVCVLIVIGTQQQFACKLKRFGYCLWLNSFFFVIQCILNKAHDRKEEVFRVLKKKICVLNAILQY